MSKKRKRTSTPTSTFTRPRGVSTTTSPALFVPDFLRLRPLSTIPRSGRILLDIEDRRTYSPRRVTSSRTPRQVARVLMATPRSGSRAMSREVYSFKIPRSTVVCVRRSIRKEVIHAKGVAGSAVRKPRRNALSRISCRRK